MDQKSSLSRSTVDVLTVLDSRQSQASQIGILYNAALLAQDGFRITLLRLKSSLGNEQTLNNNETISTNSYNSIINSLKRSKSTSSVKLSSKPSPISRSDHSHSSTTYNYHFSDGTSFQISTDLSAMIESLNRVERPFLTSQDSDEEQASNKMIDFHLKFLSKINRLKALKLQVYKNLNQKDSSWIHVATDFKIWKMIWDCWDGGALQEDLWGFLSSNFTSPHIKQAFATHLQISSLLLPTNSNLDMNQSSIYASTLKNSMILNETQAEETQTIDLIKYLEEIIQSHDGKIMNNCESIENLSLQNLKDAFNMKMIKSIKIKKVKVTAVTESKVDEVDETQELAFRALISNQSRQSTETLDLSKTERLWNEHRSDRQTSLKFKWRIQSKPQDPKSQTLFNRLGRLQLENRFEIFLPDPNSLESIPNPSPFLQKLVSGDRASTFILQASKSGDQDSEHQIENSAIVLEVVIPFEKLTDQSSTELEALRSYIQSRISKFMDTDLGYLKESIVDETISRSWESDWDWLRSVQASELQQQRAVDLTDWISSLKDLKIETRHPAFQNLFMQKSSQHDSQVLYHQVSNYLSPPSIFTVKFFRSISILALIALIGLSIFGIFLGGLLITLVIAGILHYFGFINFSGYLWEKANDE